METLATCSDLRQVSKRLHPARTRRELIFGAGVLQNIRLLETLGSQERATFYDGMVAAGNLSENPYWPARSK